VKKKKKTEKNVRITTLFDQESSVNVLVIQVDMDKLADGLQKLGEDDLLQVVQMVHDNKAPDSYTVNDVERRSPS
jgi:transcription initiation factor IIF auxiliary subunit